MAYSQDLVIYFHALFYGVDYVGLIIVICSFILFSVYLMHFSYLLYLASTFKPIVERNYLIGKIMELMLILKLIKIIKINLNQLLKKRMKKTMQNVKEKLKKKKQKNVVKIVIKWLSEKEKGILNVNKKLKKERVLLQILMVLEISLRNLQLLLLV